MKKIFWISGAVILLGFVALFFFHLSGESEASDYGIIYDSNNNKIKKFKTHESVRYISNLMGNVGTSSKGLHEVEPKDHQFKLHYVLYQRKPKLKLDMYVYDNMKVTIKNIPIVSFGTWKVSQKQYAKLIDTNNIH